MEKSKMKINSISRRSFLIGTSGLLSVAVLSSCVAVQPAAAPAAASQPAASAVAAGYPRDVTDAIGLVSTIAAPPQRIVCLCNLWDLDSVLSLGVAPVQFGIRAFIEAYTGSPLISWEWHETALAKFDSEIARVNGDTVNVETIALAQPDLIIGLSGKEGVEQLTELAPFIQLTPNWRENLRIVGAALALEEQAAQLIEETDARIATSLDEFNLDTAPTIAVISCYDAVTFNFFGHPADGRFDLFQRAGFAMLEDLTAQATAETPVIDGISIEVVEQLAPADVIVLFDYGSDGVNPSGLVTNPLFQQLPAVQAGRLIVLTQGELAQGLSTISPLNIDFCLTVVRQAGELLAAS